MLPFQKAPRGFFSTGIREANQERLYQIQGIGDP